MTHHPKFGEWCPEMIAQWAAEMAGLDDWWQLGQLYKAGFTGARSKNYAYTHARELYAVVGVELGWSLPKLANAIGVHHTTILLARRRALAATVERLMEVVNG